MSDSPGSTSPVRVAIVDDHVIVRQGLALLINQEPDLLAEGEAGNAAEAIALLEETAVDLLILDLSLGEDDGLDLLKNIRSRWPALPVLVLSMHAETLFAERVLRAGAKGYVMKHEASDSVLTAIRQVLGGGLYVSESMEARMLERVAGDNRSWSGTPVDALTDRELQVFRLIGLGRSTREIASELGLSVKTVESHREHIKQKLSLASGTQLVRRAVRWVELGDAS